MPCFSINNYYFFIFYGLTFTFCTRTLNIIFLQTNYTCTHKDTQVHTKTHIHAHKNTHVHTITHICTHMFTQRNIHLHPLRVNN